jgi:serine/threonine protein kinase
MELVPGRTLSAFVKDRLGGERPSPADLRQQLRLFDTICRAVTHAHQRSVIHRDLKPSNIAWGKPAQAAAYTARLKPAESFRSALPQSPAPPPVCACDESPSEAY